MPFRDAAVAHNVYLPIIKRERAGALRGLAMAPPASDAALLDISWRYNWWHITDKFPGAQGEFVPMLWYGLPDKRLPADYAGPLLVMNEPDNIKQLNISPQEAAERMITLRAAYPQAQIVAPACLSYNIDWLGRFYDCGQHPDVWAFHAYVEGPYNADAIIGQLERMHQRSGGNAWITEFGVMDGNLDQFKALVSWMLAQPWIERIAPYINRQPRIVDWWIVDHRIELVNLDGTLTPMGEYYRSC